MALRIDDPHGTLDPVKSDSPTKSKRGQPAAPVAATQPVAARDAGSGFEAANLKADQPAPARQLGSVDEALASAPRPVNTRVARDVWELLNRRAESIDVPLRLLITDALVRVLEIPATDHATQIQATRRREQLAKIDA